jgi:hypothetical protein
MPVYLDDVARSIAAELGWDWQSIDERRRLLLRAYAVLVRSKGVHVTEEDVHDTWAAWMAGEDPGHPYLKPFSELNEPTRRADEPFTAAIRAIARALQNAHDGCPAADQATRGP